MAGAEGTARGMAAMAQDEPKPDIHEQVRRQLQALVRNLGFLLAVVACGWGMYMLFVGSDERRQFGSVEDTLNAYTVFARTYVGSGGGKPSNPAVADYLRFFDRDSRRFFDDNFEQMARARNAFNQDVVLSMTEGERRAEAMLFLVNRPPLSGIVRVETKRPLGTNVQEVTVVGSDRKTYKIKVREDGGIFLIMEMGGIQGEIVGDLARMTRAPRPIPKEAKP